MTQAPILFDRALLATRRDRASRLHPRADFLHKHAASMVKERLEEVNKSFLSPVIISHQADLWAQELGLDARLREDAETLTLGLQQHDLILHGLGLHWHHDPVGQLIQMHRALKPDGLMIAVMFGGETLHELRTSFAVAEEEVLGGISPRVAPMAEIRDLGALLQRAGFALPVADSIQAEVTYADTLALMRDLRAMGETNVMHARHKAPLNRTLLARIDAIYRERFALPDGRLPATFDIQFLTGWAPHESQQKPLKPGSAQTSLASALNPGKSD